MNVLTRVMQAAWEEANKPIGHPPGLEFKRFVRNVTFPESKYVLLDKLHAYSTNSDFTSTLKEPDFKFQSPATGHEFFVETRYYHGFHHGMLDWCKPYQLKKYQEIDNKSPVYITIGIGGQPAVPEHVCLIPMNHIKFTRLYQSILSKYGISPRNHVAEEDLTAWT